MGGGAAERRTERGHPRAQNAGGEVFGGQSPDDGEASRGEIVKDGQHTTVVALRDG